VFDVTQDYLAFHERKTSRQMGADLEVDYSGDLFRITRLSLDGDPQAMQLVLRPGDGITVEVDVYRPAGTGRPQVSFGIVRADGSPVFGTTSEIDGAVASALDENHVRYVVTLRALPLLPGSYSLKLHAMDPEGMRVFDTVDRGLTVRGQSRQFGMVRLDYDWS
jgi:lipopolysaccharide transport system ATP-binding protein